MAVHRRRHDRPADIDTVLSRGLAGYVRAVADAVNVAIEATDFEVSDTATAYLGLPARSDDHPGRDLMLVWSERHGWALAVETAPAEEPSVLAYLGVDAVPEPREVARFVSDTLADSSTADQTAPSIRAGRDDVGARLIRYA